MIDIETLQNQKCLFCNGKFDRHPTLSDLNKRTFSSRKAEICSCGRSGFFNFLDNTLFHLYYNEYFTIGISTDKGLNKTKIYLMKNLNGYATVSRSLELGKNIEIKAELDQIDSIEKLFSMVDNFVGTLPFE
jgi:hypothetical protein